MLIILTPLSLCNMRSIFVDEIIEELPKLFLFCLLSLLLHRTTHLRNRFCRRSSTMTTSTIISFGKSSKGRLKTSQIRLRYRVTGLRFKNFAQKWNVALTRKRAKAEGFVMMLFQNSSVSWLHTMRQHSVNRPGNNNRNELLEFSNTMNATDYIRNVNWE